MQPIFFQFRRLLAAVCLTLLFCSALLANATVSHLAAGDSWLIPAAQAAPFDRTTGQEPHPAPVQITGPASAQELQLDGQTVLARPGVHFGTPRLSPDGSLLAVTVVPGGTETARLAEIYLIERASGRVIRRIPGHSPRWQQDGRRLRFQQPQADWDDTRGSRADVYAGIYDIASQRLVLADAASQPAQPRNATIPPPEGAAVPVYPRTIRVAHHPENNCRDVPDWQVDEIPFEEYVARSVPAEIPAFWPPDALAAQAVATRTYAWFQILQNRPDYDVTDWADFQMMCDDRYPAADAATERTAGQYLAWAGSSNRAPIIAMYSAMNSHPTLDNPARPYLEAVADETGLGEARWGHGFGLSQWGAARRAKAGQSYRQILGHYYTDVTLQNAQQPDAPVGGFIGLPLSGYLPAGGLRWRTLAPAQPLPGEVTLRSGQGLTRTVAVTRLVTVTSTQTITHETGITETIVLTETTLLTDTNFVVEPLGVSLPTRGVWQRVPGLADGVALTASLFLQGALQEQVPLSIDWTPPPPPLFEAPALVEVPTATLRLASRESGARIGLSSGWIWQGEELLRTANAGEDAGDSYADGGLTREVRAGEHAPGWWYGPYATGIPHNATYRGIFRLRIGTHPAARSPESVLPDQPIARLDVTDRGGELLLGLRHIWPSDFAATGAYAEIPVDFHLFEPVEGLEFRVQWHGEVDLALDRVQLWQLQEQTDGTVDWPLTRSGQSVLQAIAFDAAGNASQPVSRTVEFGKESPPQFGALGVPAGWQRRLPVTLTVPVQDFGSGLDVNSGRLLLGGVAQVARFSQAQDPLAPQQLSAVLADVADGTYSVQFRAADRSGLVQESDAGLLRVDQTPPLVTAVAVQASGGEVEAGGWASGPVQIIIRGEDATSGVDGLAYVLDDAPFELYDQPFFVSAEGAHRLRYWGQDSAGNYSWSQVLDVGIDSTAPQISLTLGTVTAESAVLHFAGSDGLSGLAGVEAQVDRGGANGWQPLALAADQRTVAVAFHGAGQMQVRLRAADAAGNFSAWAVAQVPRPAAEPSPSPLPTPTPKTEIFIPAVGK